MLSKKDFTPLQFNTLLIFLFIGLIKVTGFLRDAQIANFFGITKMTDLYYYALVVPFFIYNLFVGSFNVYFIPTYSKIKLSPDPNTRYKYLTTIFLTFTVALSIIFLSSYFCIRGLLTFNPGIIKTPEELAYFLLLSQWAGLFLFFYSVSSLFISLLQAEHHYVRSLYPQIFIPLGSVLFILFCSKTAGTIVILQGAALGALLCTGVLYYYTSKLKLFSNSLQFSSRNFLLDMNLQQFFFLLLTYLLPNLINLIDRQIAVNLGEGKITALNYGFIIPDGLYEICTVGLGVASFSYFSQWYSENRKNLITDAAQKVIATILFLILPICAFLFIYAQPILSVLFKRGQFSYEDTFVVAEILKTHCLMFFLATLIVIGQRIISATSKNNILIIIGLIGFVIKITINIPLTQLLGVKGLPLATNIMFFFVATMTFLYLQRNGFRLFDKKILRTMLMGIFISALLFLIFGTILIYTNSFSDIHKITIGTTVFLLYLIGVWFFYKKYRVLGAISFTS